MSARARLCASLLGMALCGSLPVAPTEAQTGRQQHVVSEKQLNSDAARGGETRVANEAAVRHLLSSDAGRQALQSAHVEYQRIDKAIGQLNDEDLAKLAERSRQAENDFAAGFLSPKHLAELILVIVVIVVIIVLV